MSAPDAGILMREAMKTNHSFSHIERPKESSQPFKTTMRRQGPLGSGSRDCAHWFLARKKTMKKLRRRRELHLDRSLASFAQLQNYGPYVTQNSAQD
ncbi:MAG: hypothetical protein DMG39_26615 [Acidobacteria bacterium]|nr:MAG: hypothetical protein DMG39_26615 [Acidobacteriota bacterium]